MVTHQIVYTTVSIGYSVNVAPRWYTAPWWKLRVSGQRRGDGRAELSLQNFRLTSSFHIYFHPYQSRFRLGLE